MQFIDTPAFGDPDVMVLNTCESPKPADHEVLIQVKAAGVNRPDVIQRMGLYPAPKDASPILGLEVAGSVAAVGTKVTRWKVGDPICALTNGGGYAELVAVPEGQCLAIPDGLSMIEAASLPETHFTVWSNVIHRAKLQPGESFLIHGGTSGIGTCAIQIMKALGNTVFATAGSDEKCAACVELGADAAINYRKHDFVDAIKSANNSKGIDVILDMVGGDYLTKNIKLAAQDGRIVNIAYLNGSIAEVNFMPVMLKRLMITGSTLRPQSSKTKTNIANELSAKIWPLYESKKLKPVIAKKFTLENAVEAHRLMESNQHIGKIVLTL